MKEKTSKLMFQTHLMMSKLLLEEPKEYFVSKGLMLYVLATTVFFLAIKYVDWSANKEQIVFYEDRFTYFYIIAVAGPVILDILHRTGKLKYSVVLVMTMVFCAFTTGLTLYYYKDDDTSEYISKYEASINLKTLNDQYRYHTRDNVFALVGGGSSIGCFSSTIENSAHEFNMLLEVDTNNSSQGRINVPGLGQLLGGRYMVTGDAGAENIVDTVNYKNKTLYVTEQEAFPIGFAMDKYMYANELAKLPFEKRGIALMNAAVIMPGEEANVTSCMTHIDVSSIDYNIPVDDMARAAQQVAVGNFSRDYHGFKCTTDYGKETMIYFSVPNDKGWTVTIDGQKTPVIDSCGMMLLKVPSGHHAVEFTYHTVGFKAGAALAIVSWAAFAGLCIYLKVNDKKSGKGAKA